MVSDDESLRLPYCVLGNCNHILYSWVCDWEDEMSVLIRGMKLPENCVGCPLAKNYGMCAITKKTFNWGNPNRLSDCPLIEILPHGRLIIEDGEIVNE